MSFTVAIAGRPNVGKSTLFNRLTGKQAAIVDDTPGVTRDWKDAAVNLQGLSFRLMDTAGIDIKPSDDLGALIRTQTLQAIAQADVILFVIDGREGITPFDREIARQLRRGGKPILLVVNKADTRASEATVDIAESLGFGEAVAVSAAHGTGLGELHDALLPHAPADALDDDEDSDEGEDEAAAVQRPLTIAITGRPNAGKSTLLNQLIGSERAITSPIAGTTRDAVEVEWDWDGRRIRLVDTAGLRRKARVEEGLEKMSVSVAIEEIKMAEVVVLVIDAAIPFETQDLQIADLVEREGRAMVVAVNKWDLVEDKAQLLRTLIERVDQLLPQWKGVPIVALSALSGEGIERLMPAIVKQHEIWNRRIATNKLNAWLQYMTEKHSPPAPKGRRIKIRYMTQARTRPPTFAISSSQPGELPGDYARYLINGLRETFGFHGVPIRMKVKAGKNPFDKS
ncbi:MAG: ribosome biogenesis GTPase Der [Alphaproteobacteria bacterium]|jgi:GTP-binding protein